MNSSLLTSPDFQVVLDLIQARQDEKTIKTFRHRFGAGPIALQDAREVLHLGRRTIVEEVYSFSDVELVIEVDKEFN